MKPVIKDVTYAALYGMYADDLDLTLWDLRDDEFRFVKGVSGILRFAQDDKGESG